MTLALTMERSEQAMERPEGVQTPVQLSVQTPLQTPLQLSVHLSGVEGLVEPVAPLQPLEGWLKRWMRIIELQRRLQFRRRLWGVLGVWLKTIRARGRA